LAIFYALPAHVTNYPLKFWRNEQANPLPFVVVGPFLKNQTWTRKSCQLWMHLNLHLQPHLIQIDCSYYHETHISISFFLSFSIPEGSYYLEIDHQIVPQLIEVSSWKAMAPPYLWDWGWKQLARCSTDPVSVKANKTLWYVYLSKRKAGKQSGDIL
jgi:hypothetical protein